MRRNSFRQLYIRAYLTVHGKINRSDIADMFGISRHRASMDLKDFQYNYPKSLAFDPTQKCYTSRYVNPFVRDAETILDLFDQLKRHAL